MTGRPLCTTERRKRRALGYGPVTNWGPCTIGSSSMSYRPGLGVGWGRCLVAGASATENNVQAMKRLWVAVATSLLSCGPPQYFPPDLPPDRLVEVTVDDRAEVQLIDGRWLARRDEPAVREFRISTGCHELTARYGQSYTYLVGDDGPVSTFELVEAATRVRTNTYRTEEPIRFNLLAKPRRKYWVTATFTGDVFLPRISEIDEASGEAVSAIFPDTPCRSTLGRQTER